MPIHVGSVSTEVVPEPEVQGPADDRRFEEVERLRRLTDRLRRLALRTRAEGCDD